MLHRLRLLLRKRSAVRENVVTGDEFTLGVGCSLWAPRQLSVGNNVSLGSNVRIEVDGVIGDAVLIANSTGIVGRSDHRATDVGTAITKSAWVGKFPEELSRPVNIGSDVWIGYGSTVVSGVSIGDSTIIGAGSVVTRDIPANSIAVGNPARVIGQRFDDEAFQRHWQLLEEQGVRRVVK